MGDELSKLGKRRTEKETDLKGGRNCEGTCIELTESTSRAQLAS